MAPSKALLLAGIDFGIVQTREVLTNSSMALLYFLAKVERC